MQYSINTGFLIPLLCSIYDEEPYTCPDVQLPNMFDVTFIICIIGFILIKWQLINVIN